MSMGDLGQLAGAVWWVITHELLRWQLHTEQSSDSTVAGVDSGQRRQT